MTTMIYEFVLYILPIVLAMYNEFHLKNGFSTINVYDNSLPTRKILPFNPTNPNLRSTSSPITVAGSHQQPLIPKPPSPTTPKIETTIPPKLPRSPSHEPTELRVTAPNPTSPKILAKSFCLCNRVLIKDRYTYRKKQRRRNQWRKARLKKGRQVLGRVRGGSEF